MNNGAFGENFPYSNFHDLNMDWIIKIAKDFLDQYTHIQETIDNGLEQLQTKADNLEELLQQWYNTHSEDIANQLADALEDLNNWYTTHEGYLDQYVADSITEFNTRAEQKAADTIATIPPAYTELSDKVEWVSNYANNGIVHQLVESEIEQGGFFAEGPKMENPARLRTINRIPVKKGDVVRFTAGTKITNMYWYFWKNGVFQEASGWINNTDYVIAPENGEYNFSFKSGDETEELIPSDYDADVTIKSYILANAGYSRAELLVWLGSNIFVDTQNSRLTITPGFITIRYGINNVKLIRTGENIVVQGQFSALQNLYFNTDTSAFFFESSGVVNNNVSQNNILDLGHFYNDNIDLYCFPGYYLNNEWISKTDTAREVSTFTSMAVLGDSISTFTGYSEADFQSPYYPRGDVTSVNDTWWKKVANSLGITNISVSAISQSAFFDYNNANYPPVYTTNRINRLSMNGTPDIIFVNAGTNDGFTTQTADIVYSADIPTLEALPNTTVRGIALTIRKLQSAYPNAKIVLLIPKQVRISTMPEGYTLERVSKIADYIVDYADILGAWKVIDLRKCGITQTNVASYCEDGQIHPNARGMTKMAQYIVEELQK